jgi:zinc transport system substrate-binding protein
MIRGINISINVKGGMMSAKLGTRLIQLLLLIVAVGLTLPVGPAPAQAQERVRVVVSFYPLQEAVQKVGGDRIVATNLVAAGAEPHDLELTPRDVETIRQAQLVVFLGAGFQPTVERAVAALAGSNVTVVDVARNMPLRPGEGEFANATDPHVWLDPLLLKQIVVDVRDALLQLDPAGRDLFEANTIAYQAALDQLHEEMRAGLENCTRREIVTGHAAYAYLAARYNLRQIAVTGLSPDAEPSPREMQEIIRLARQYGVRVVYTEPGVDPRLSATVARELGARTRVLNPIEGITVEEQAAGKGYVDLMRENLSALREGLGCR